MSKQKILFGSLAAALVVGIGGFLWWQLGMSKASPLHVYYPEKTTFFLEAEPGDQLARRMIRWADLQQKQQKAAAPKAGQAAKSKQSEVEAEQFQRALFDKFGTTFMPHVSVGLWPQADQKNHVATSDMMAILPMKQPMTFPTLVARFNGKKEHFKHYTENHVTYYVDQTAAKDPQARQESSTFAVIDQQLFITNRPAVMRDLIQHLKADQSGRTDKNIFDHPTTKQYLRLLDSNRDGTLIINNTAYAEQLRNLGKSVPSAIPPALRDRVLLYANVTPLTLGALHVEDGTQLETSFYMPLNLKALQNPKLSEEVKTLYKEKKQLSAAKFLPANTSFLLDAHGLDNWFDLYSNHLMPQAQKMQLTQAAMLLNFVQLNFRNDLIGLLSGESAFASLGGNPIPIILLESTEAKQASFNKILSMLTSGKFFPVQHKEEQIGKVEAHTFVIPKQNQQVSVGTLDKKMIAFAQANEFSQLASIQEKQPSLADDEAYKTLTKHFPKDVALLLYSDIDANQTAFQRTLKQTRLTPGSEATLSLANRLTAESKNDKTQGLSKMAAAIWAEPRGNAEDLVQAKVVLQLKPE